MTRIKSLFVASGLAALGVCATNAWTQDERSSEKQPLSRESKEDAPRRERGDGDANAFRPPRDSSPKPRITGDQGGENQKTATGEIRRLMIEHQTLLEDLGPDHPKVNTLGRKIESKGRMNGSRELVTRARVISRPGQHDEVVYETVEVSAESQEFQSARMALRDAKDDNERQKAVEVIRQCLNKQFERDLVQREQEVAAVEERVRLLRQQLNKRRTSKDEIVSLRLKTIQHDAEGLGFPGEGLDDLGRNPPRVLGDYVVPRTRNYPESERGVEETPK